MNIFFALVISIFAALCADGIWYELGRIKGIKILQLLCKISLEPDSCVRRTEGLFSTQGARSLIFAKFLPGLGTVAPPLAGVFHMPPGRFLMFDGLGTLLWAGTFLGVGFVFSGQIEQIAGRLAALGGRLGLLLLLAFGLYIAYKFHRPPEIHAPAADLAHHGRGIKRQNRWRRRYCHCRSCVTPWTLKPTRKRSPERFAWMLRSCSKRTIASLAIAMSFFTALDQTKPPAPVWRCYYENKASNASGPCKAAWKPGARRVTPWRAPPPP